VRKPEGKSTLGKPRYRLEDNIKIGPNGMRWSGMEYVNLSQDSDQWRALLNTIVHFVVPQNIGKFLST
jgi:hypothetical protein